MWLKNFVKRLKVHRALRNTGAVLLPTDADTQAADAKEKNRRWSGRPTRPACSGKWRSDGGSGNSELIQCIVPQWQQPVEIDCCLVASLLVTIIVVRGFPNGGFFPGCVAVVIYPGLSVSRCSRLQTYTNLQA